MRSASMVRRLLVGGVAVLAALAALLGGAGGGEQRTHSITSAAPDGRRALAALFGELGLRPAAWHLAPADLPTAGGVLWAAAAPSGRADEALEPEESLESEAPTDRRSTADPRHRAHYARFVEEGGTLILPAAERSFLDGVLTDPLPELERVARDAAAVERLSVGGERLEVRTGAHLALGAGAEAARVAVLCADERGRAQTLAIPVGGGRLVLLADDGFVANESLGELDHALWAVRLIEELAPGGPVLFDEYALGAFVPPGKLALALGDGALGVTLHLFALLGLALWALAGRREFPRDPRHSTRVSPLARVRATARLHERAGRYDLSARQLRDGVVGAAARRAGLSRALVTTDERLAGLLACVEARGGAPGPAASAHPRDVGDARALDRFARSLGELEAALEDDGPGGRETAAERGVA